MKAVVIGGGITGLAVTDELTRRGVRVDLLERSAELGQEASSAAAGILAPQSEAEGPGPFLQLLLAAAQMIPEAVSRLEALTGISVGHRVSGMLALAFSDADRQALEKSLEWQTQAGLAPERMDPPAARRMEPALDGPLQAAVYWPQTAALDPRQFVRAYARAVERQGASVHLNTAAKKVVVRAGRVAGVETAAGLCAEARGGVSSNAGLCAEARGGVSSNAGLIEADWVIHCAGPWAGEEIGLPFGLPSIPARGQILQFSTRAPLFQRVVKSPRAYLVQRADGCLVAGTTLEYVGFDKRTTEEGIRKVHSGVKEISAKAGALPVESSWAGLRPDTPDHLPVLGPTPLEGFLAAFGHFRNGILLAPLTGRLIADQILGSRSSLDLAPFSLARYNK